MSRIRLASAGYCYILGNGSMPGILKIGATTDLPEIRAKQLTASTASPTPFTVLYSRAVPDCTAIEDATHRAFVGRRVNENREFFQVSLLEAAMTLDKMVGGTEMKWKPATPWAELFSRFADDGSDRELMEEEKEECRKLERRLKR